MEILQQWTQLLAIIWLTASVDKIYGDTATDFMKDLLEQHPTVKDEPPAAGSKKSTEVRIGIYVNSISEGKDGQGMQQSLNIYLRNAWKDYRLEFNPMKYDNKKEILLPDEAWRKIWVPDLFIRNEQKAVMHGTSRENILLKVNATGHAWFVIKATTTTSCPMNLQKYPFDTQKCPIMFESFRYTMDTMYLSWLENPVDIDQSVQIPEFDLVEKILYDCSQNYTAGAFPCLEIQFIMSRNIGVYILKVFLPTILVVIMSWFNLWLEPNNYAQRITILIILALALMFQYNTYGKDVADVSYVKAFDVWMILCLLFLLLSMIQATVVSIIAPSPSPGVSSSSNKYLDHNHMTELDPTSTGSSNRNKKCCCCYRISVAKTIDMISRILFPAGFTVSVVVYFTAYMQPSNQL